LCQGWTILQLNNGINSHPSTDTPTFDLCGDIEPHPAIHAASILPQYLGSLPGRQETDDS
jgi:hypothetical protein